MVLWEAKAFGDKYNVLYNSVVYNQSDVVCLRKDVNNLMSKLCCSGLCYNMHNVSVSEVLTAVKHMKHGKYDGNVGHCSDHFKHCTHKLFVCLTLLFDAMLTHGYVPSDMQLATITPLPKNRNKSW